MKLEEERRWRSGDGKQLNSKHLMMQSLHDRATIDTVGTANEYCTVRATIKLLRGWLKMILIDCSNLYDVWGLNGKDRLSESQNAGKARDSRIGTIS